MILELILLELLLGAMLLGFMGSYKKRIADRVILFLTIPISFIGAIWLSKSEYYGQLGDFVMNEIDLGEFPASVAATVEALMMTLARPILVVVAFWVLLFAFRIVLGIILTIVHLFLHTRRKEKARGKKRSKANKLITGLLGVLSGFIVMGLSFLPLVYVNDIAEPAVEAALAEENKGTYAEEVATEIDTVAMPFSEGTTLSKIMKFTGMRALYTASLKNMTDASVTLENGKTVEFNSLELIRLLGKEGVKALVIYEETCDADASLADLKPAADILKTLAESDIILALGTEYLSGLEATEPTDESDVGEKLTYFIVNEYGSGDTATVKNDADALAALVELLTTDLAEVGLDTEELLPALLEYMQDEEDSAKLVNTLAKTNLYNEGFPGFMEFGLEMIAEAMNLSTDKKDDYNNYIASLGEALNDKSIGTYNTDGVELFIKYCADNSVTVESYGIMNPDELTDIDVGYTSYLYFFAKMQNAATVFSDYLVADENGAIAFVSADGSTVYVYDEETTAWKYHTDELVNIGSVVGALFVNAVNDLILENPEVAIMSEDITELARAYAEKLKTSNGVVFDDVNALLASVYDEEAFTPDTVYAEDVINALNKDAELDEEHNTQFAKALSIMAGIYNSMTEGGSTEASLDTIMNHFGDVGRMLDCLAAMESTREVPDVMLRSIMNNKDYSVYFGSEPVRQLIENVRNGESTYEELFSYVQAIYNIASGIMPS